MHAPAPKVKTPSQNTVLQNKRGLKKLLSEKLEKLKFRQSKSSSNKPAKKPPSHFEPTDPSAVKVLFTDKVSIYFGILLTICMVLLPLGYFLYQLEKPIPLPKYTTHKLSNPYTSLRYDKMDRALMFSDTITKQLSTPKHQINSVHQAAPNKKTPALKNKR